MKLQIFISINQQKKMNVSKMQREIPAINSEIQRYKKTYLNKSVLPDNVEQFIRFSKQLIFLLTSHCKNIAFFIPQKLPESIEELSIIFDDIINKYYLLSLKSNERQSQIVKSDNRLNPSVGMCLVCSSQTDKVHIQLMKKQLLNEFGNLNESQKLSLDNEDEVDYFTELFEALENKHGQIMKNQMEISLYHDFALSAIQSLTTLGKYFHRDSVVIPKTDWIESAKNQMENTLRIIFDGKIPPWIKKMFSMFMDLYHTQSLKNRIDVEVQTINNYQLELFEQKKKVLLLNDKISKSQQKLKSSHEKNKAIAHEKQILELENNYYKKELNKLLQEIETIKIDNNGLERKIEKYQHQTEDQKHRIQSIITNSIGTIDLGTAKSKKRKILNSESTIKGQKNILPKIIMISQDKRKSSTSINKLISRQSERRSTKKKTYKIDESQIAPIVHSEIEKQNSLRNHKKPSNFQNTQPTTHFKESVHNDVYTSSVIQQENDYDEDKIRANDVNDHLKQLVNIKRHYLSSSIPNDLPKQTLKRGARKSNLVEKKEVELEFTPSVFLNKSIKQQTNRLIENILETIYDYLIRSGYLLNTSRENFKQVILKIKDIDLSLLSTDQFRRYLEREQIVNGIISTFQRHIKDRKTQNKKPYLRKTQRHAISSLYPQQIVQVAAPQINVEEMSKQYIFLFINEEKAYEYQSSLTKNNSKNLYSMSNAQGKYCQQIYELLEKIKKSKFNIYKFLCSFLRYPYQVLKNDFGIINLVTGMKYANLHEYFQRLMKIHGTCKKQNGLCDHLQDLENKLKAQLQ